MSIYSATRRGLTEADRQYWSPSGSVFPCPDFFSCRAGAEVTDHLKRGQPAGLMIVQNSVFHVLLPLPRGFPTALIFEGAAVLDAREQRLFQQGASVNRHPQCRASLLDMPRRQIDFRNRGYCRGVLRAQARRGRRHLLFHKERQVLHPLLISAHLFDQSSVYCNA